jgi:hypothetical protein
MAEIHSLIERIGREAALEQARNDSERRRILWASEVMSAEQIRRWYLHSGFCLVALPHSRPKDTRASYVLRNGKFSLILQPKAIGLDEAGEAEFIGLPYGPKARLILMYVQSYALRHRTRTVVLGESMSEWLRRLGLTPSGGERGTIGAVQEQAQRISRCEFTMVWEDGNSRRLRDQPLVRGLEMFTDLGGGGDTDEKGQMALFGPAEMDAARPRRRRYTWVKEIEISTEFYEHLLEHKVVLREDAISRLKGSSWALDVYVWLAYRLRSVTKPTAPIPWPALMDQFGGYKSNPSMFKTVMRDALQDVLAVYPEANVEWNERGVILRPSAPPVLTDLHPVRSLSGA